MKKTSNYIQGVSRRGHYENQSKLKSDECGASSYTGN